MKRRIAVLGATGSVGTSVMRVLRAMKDDFQVVLLSGGGRRTEELAALAKEFSPDFAVTSNPDRLDSLKNALPRTVRAYAGDADLCNLLEDTPLDMVVCAIPGLPAMNPVITALRKGINVALSTKEVIVAAGSHVMTEATAHGAKILPVDSEHSAIFQCLDRHNPAEVESLLLTASGGPFRTYTAEQLNNVTYAQALNHPTWNMGPKVTLDSATLMNKAFEMVEAHHLFQVPQEKVQVVVHPQSIVHSMVEWCDGSVTALLSAPNMSFPAQYALTYPQRVKTCLPRLNFAEVAKLTFEQPNESLFLSLQFARNAMIADGIMPGVMLAANESACDRFIRAEISLPQIWQIIAETMEHFSGQNSGKPSFSEIMSAVDAAHRFAADLPIKQHQKGV